MTSPTALGTVKPRLAPKRLFAFLIIAASVLAADVSRVPAQTGRSPARQRTQSITGRVIDESGQPLTNVSVAVYGPSIALRPYHATLTDEAGRFVVENLRSGPYTVNVTEPVMVRADDPLIRSYYRPGDDITIRMIRGGVITGIVTDATGQPVVGVPVRAIMSRDKEGRVSRNYGALYARTTDDRGMYRLFGLAPGSYTVMAGSNLFSVMANPFEEHVPTYHPSGTRDTAVEVQVRSGEETRGIDIRYRGERGHTVSGTFASEGGSPEARGGMIQLVSVATGKMENGTPISPMQSTRAFAFFGVGEGEYMLVAQGSTSAGDGQTFASEPQRVVVKQSDVTGLVLRLAPLSSIAGKVTLEGAPADIKNPECKQRGRVEEILINARNYSAGDEESKPWLTIVPTGSAPAETGEFNIQSLRAGRYRLDVRLLSENQYLRGISRHQSPSAKARDVAIEGLALGAGERAGDVSISVVEGAAGLAGKVEAARLPEGLQVHLAPAEAESGNDLFRYYDAIVNSDGTFSVTNLAPGRYSVVLLVSPVARSQFDRPRPVAWEPAMRKRIQNQANTSKNEIELKPCERAKDLVLQYSPSASNN